MNMKVDIKNEDEKTALFLEIRDGQEFFKNGKNKDELQIQSIYF